jgi:negative regulator of flagellin synthesis FlgM
MPIEIGTTRVVSIVDMRITRNDSGADEKPASPVKSGPAVVRSDALNPGQVPIDTDRVSAIRHAVETGNYPIIPARVADAMIAAGILLRNGK